MPAVGLVSRPPGSAPGARRAGGASLGLVAGAGFGLLFVALDLAGRRHGAWPLLPGQAVSLLFVLPFAGRGLRTAKAPAGRTLAATITAGILSGTVNLLYLLAARYGELAIIGVVTSQYPAGTVLIARLRLSEPLEPRSDHRNARRGPRGRPCRGPLTAG